VVVVVALRGVEVVLVSLEDLPAHPIRSVVRVHPGIVALFA